VATICGVTLFEQGKRQLSSYLSLHAEKMALLPKAVRQSFIRVKDDF